MSFINAVWTRRIIRAIGIANLLFVIFGGYFAVTGAPHILPRLHDSPVEPRVREAYCVMTLVDLCCLVALTVGGVYLVRLKRLGLRICNFGFAAEIIWFLGTSWIALALGLLGGRWEPLGRSIAAAGGIGGLGTAPQIITGYPVLALIFLNLARRGFPNHAVRA